MARIRTIKPIFFTNHKLFKAEQESGLPLRICFAGLWGQSDREGRFEWIPEQLKIGIVPYDDLDFSRVLDALWTRGYVEKYEAENCIYGYIPSFLEHQVINNRETESILPEPTPDNTLTRAGRVDDAKATRRPRPLSGREGKGREGSKARVNPSEDEVIAYFHENGYTRESALKAFQYYRANDWKDSSGKPVLAWKQKMIAVWFKDENKIPKPAPSSFRPHPSLQP